MDKLPEQIDKVISNFLAGDSSLPQAFLFIGTNLDHIVKKFAEKVTSGHFPNNDSIVVDAGTGDFGIAEARELMHLATLKPVSEQYRMVLLRNLQNVNKQVMNSLLKTLEEPPKQTIFLLTSSTALLPTVMSRCQIFHLEHSLASLADLSDGAKELYQQIEHAQKLGLAEKLVLVNQLAESDTSNLLPALQVWLDNQAQRLAHTPELFPAVRQSLMTIQNLQSNLNKKMVLQNFVTQGLV